MGMNEILKTYLSVSLSASFLIMLLMVCRPLYQKRFSRRWQYYIWLVVIVRLVLPWNPGNGIVGQLFQEKRLETWVGQALKAQNESGQENMREETAAQNLSSQNEIKQNGNEQVLKEQVLDEQILNDISTQDDIYNKPVWYQKIQMLLQNIWVLWLSAAFVLLIRKIIIYQSFVKFLKAGCTAVEDMERLEALGKLMEQNHIRRMTGLYTNSLTASPLLIGFIHPSIILTKAQLSDLDFHYTILHELTHNKRRDMFYKWLVQFVICLHWFNPLVYWMEREIGRSCELSCDEAVMKNLDAEGRRQYGDTLLRAMGAGGVYHNTLASMTLNESRELLKERLGAIMNDKKKTRFTAVLSAAAALMLAGSAVVTGAYMQPAAAEIKAGQMQLSDCKMIQKGDEYYILCEGADEQDMPTGGVTEGCVGITLVKKDEYTGIGPFDDMDRLVQDVTEMVTYMRGKKEITEAEAQVFIEAAEKIQKDTSHKLAETEAQVFTEDTQKDALDVKINRTFVFLKKGKSITLKLTGTKKQAVWSSDNAKIAAVGKNGKVTAKKAGSTKITAKLGGHTYACKVKVNDSDSNGAKAKKEAAAEEYQKWGITVRNGAYFYKDKRIRIFMDLRADHSFVLFNYDQKGTIDVKLSRKKDFSVSGVAYITKAEAEEILQDMKESEADPEPEPDPKEAESKLAIARLGKKDLPDKVQKAVDKCGAGIWYVMEYGGYQYIYYQGLSNDYAFEPELSETKADIKIADMKRSGRYNVLLAVKKNVALTIHYHNREVSYQRISV